MAACRSTRRGRSTPPSSQWSVCFKRTSANTGAAGVSRHLPGVPLQRRRRRVPLRPAVAPCSRAAKALARAYCGGGPEPLQPGDPSGRLSHGRPGLCLAWLPRCATQAVRLALQPRRRWRPLCDAPTENTHVLPVCHFRHSHPSNCFFRLRFFSRRLYPTSASDSVAKELIERFVESQRPSLALTPNNLRAQEMSDRGGEVIFLLYLNRDTWRPESGAALAVELRAARAAGMHVVMMHERDEARRACPFGRLYQTTPSHLVHEDLYAALKDPPEILSRHATSHLPQNPPIPSPPASAPLHGPPTTHPVGTRRARCRCTASLTGRRVCSSRPKRSVPCRSAGQASDLAGRPSLARLGSSRACSGSAARTEPRRPPTRRAASKRRSRQLRSGQPRRQRRAQWRRWRRRG